MEGLSLVSLKELPFQIISPAEFKDNYSKIINSNGSYAIPISASGSANTRIIQVDNFKSEKCTSFIKNYYEFSQHRWSNQYLYLLNMPCYMNVQSGVLFLEDGRCIAETIYPSSGPKTVSRFIGGGVTIDNISDHFSDAEMVNGDGFFAPFFSRWSNVYFHAITETLVQDIALHRNFLKDDLHYLSSTSLSPVQRKAGQNSHFDHVKFSTVFVKAPRVAFTTLLYSHALMNDNFRDFVGAVKIDIDIGQDSNVAGGDLGRLVYVSRKGSPARQMLNEEQLQEELEKLGFRMFYAEEKSVLEQAAAFRSAELIVGAHGAGLTNAAFSKPTATIIELRPLNRAGESPMWTMSYKNLSAIMGFSYCAHVSENDTDVEEWSAQIDEIVETIRRVQLVAASNKIPG